jgi:nucleoside-diphosphate-sugar epimerase
VTTQAGPIVVTGAGGFIGGRVVEVLHALQPGRVRALVRRWASAARIGRMPVDIRLCDVTDPTAVRDALRGATAVVHCAVGDRRATVEGTRTVLAAAREEGLARVVHVSTIDVYGHVEGEITEHQPMVRTGAPYGDSKIEAEQACAEYAGLGLPIAILRPTIVYGPFSGSWTIEFAERLLARRWLLPREDCLGLCNLVYVDDLVRAILLSIDSPKAVGDAFNINGPDVPTWWEYFELLAAELGLPPLASPSRKRAVLSGLTMAPVRRTAKFVLRSFPGIVRALHQRSRVAKALMRALESRVRETPTMNEFQLYSRKAHFSAGKAREDLGFRPMVGAKEGVTLSVAWLRHHRYDSPRRAG